MTLPETQGRIEGTAAGPLRPLRSRRPASPRQRAWRDQWGKTWGNVGREIGRMIRESEQR